MRGPARLLVLAGALGVGWFLFRSTPRDVTLVYGLGDRRVASIDVEILRDGRTVRRSELHPGTGPAGNVRHPVRLPDGDYALRVRVAPASGPPERLERAITVSESTTIVLPLQGR